MQQLAAIQQWLRDHILGLFKNNRLLDQFEQQNPEQKQEMTLEQVDELIKTIEQKMTRTEQKNEKNKQKLRYFYDRDNQKQARKVTMEIKKLANQIENFSQNKRVLKAISKQLKTKNTANITAWESSNSQISMDFNHFIQNQKNKPKKSQKTEVEQYKYHNNNQKSNKTKKSALKQAQDEIALMLQSLN